MGPCAGLAVMLAALAAPPPAADFPGRPEQWLETLPFGAVDGCRLTGDLGPDDTAALRVDIAFAGGATNHLVYCRDVDWDLSWTERLEFEVRGAGQQVMLFVFLYDDQGRFTNYGPHGSNLDFHSGHADWTRLSLDLRGDRAVQSRSADLSRIQRIGFMVNADGPRRGTLWLGRLWQVPRPAGLELSRPTITPNGDGIADTTTVTIGPAAGRVVRLELLGAEGQPLANLAPERPCETPEFRLTWDGRLGRRALAPGVYHLRAAMDDEPVGEAEAVMTIDGRPPWPEAEYQAEPFVPIGVWFEGSPEKAGTPAEREAARDYYDRCFADLRAHGLNAAAVPNCPEPLWEPLLERAEAHGIGVVLEIGELAALVDSPTPLDEATVEAVARRVVGKLSGFPALRRYQIRDEPAPGAMENWLLVRRILAACDPTRPAFSCFCDPASLDRATAATPLTEAVFDIYPHYVAVEEPSFGHFGDLLPRFVAAARGAPAWAVLQAFAKPEAWRYPCSEELSAVTWWSLAHGAKGVFWFIYQTMPTHPERLEGLVNPDLSPRPIYAHVAVLAAEVAALAPLLPGLRPGEAPQPVAGAVVGSYRDAVGRRVLIVASDDLTQARSLVLPGIAGRWRDLITGAELTAMPEGLRMMLPPGGGRAVAAIE